jgi:hypothetical protein
MKDATENLSSLNVQKAAPGPIQLALKKVQNAPQRLVLGVPLALTALVSVGFIVASSFRTAESEPVESNVSDYTMVTFDPLALAGIDESTDPASPPSRCGISCPSTIAGFSSRSRKTWIIPLPASPNA